MGNGFGNMHDLNSIIRNNANQDLKLINNNDTDLLVRPGEIHMNDDEIKNGGIDPSSLTENEEKYDIRASNRTGMEIE